MGKIWARIFNMLKRNYCYEVCLCLCLCLCICLCFCLCICVPIEREYDDHWWRASVPWWPCPALHWWRPYKACKATIQPRNTNHEQLKKPKETWYSNTFCSHLKSITNPAREQAVKAPMISYYIDTIGGNLKKWFCLITCSGVSSDIFSIRWRIMHCKCPKSFVFYPTLLMLWFSFCWDEIA